ncbi:MAG: D-sedoheptulose 7-phosphate isomerase [Cyclobacteriaceae bacterium]
MKIEPIRIISEELRQAQQVLQDFLENDGALTNIHNAAMLMVDTIHQNGKIISCGNGGSHCDAMHFAEELSGRFRADRRALPAISISDPTHMSCVANDYGFSQIFSRFVEGLGKAGDVLLVISTSGNSENIINAVNAAKNQNMKVIALTGNDGGKIASLVDTEIRVPHFGFSDRIQEVHIKIVHILISLIEEYVGKD